MILLSAPASVEFTLLCVFIVIFILTAVLTLASLPDWIKIPEWYKKKLFTALILEVIGVILIIVRGAIGGDAKTAQSYTFPEEYQWVALYESGESARPRIPKANKSDTTCNELVLGSEGFKKLPELVLNACFKENSKVDLVIESTNGVKLGKLSSESLSDLGFFNLIPDVTANTDHSIIRWEKLGGKWERNMKYDDFLDDEVKFEVYNGDAGLARYRIYNTKDTVYTSKKNSEFNQKSRSIHFCKNSKNEYFLFRITSGTPFDTIKTPHVNIEQIKIAPKLQLRYTNNTK